MSTTLAERIDCLFRTHRSPRGREYTYREVAAAVSGQNGITFSPAYLWQLRTGAKDNPTMRHLEALARFFEVSPSYFFDDELTDFPETELRLLAATKHGLPRADRHEPPGPERREPGRGAAVGPPAARARGPAQCQRCRREWRPERQQQRSRAAQREAAPRRERRFRWRAVTRPV